MNIENKKQFATILLAVGLGLVAAMLMSKVVSDKVEEQTRIIAKEYQGRSAALVKELDATKQTLKKLAKDHAALAKRVAEQPKIIQQAAAPEQQQPSVQETAFSLRTPPGKRAVTIWGPVSCALWLLSYSGTRTRKNQAPHSSKKKTITANPTSEAVKPSVLSERIDREKGVAI